MNCPACKADIPEEFGIFQCASCNAALFVDFEGQVHIYEDTDEEDSSVEEDSAEFDGFGDLEEDFEGEGTGESFQEVSETSGSENIDVPLIKEEFSSSDEEPERFSLSVVKDIDDESDFVPETPNSEFTEPDVENSEEEVETQPNEVSFENEEEGEETTEPPSEEFLDEGQGGKSLEDLSEIADFGNSEISSATEGSLWYKIIIEDIDDKETGQSLQEILSESRFGFQEKIVVGVRQGRVELPRVNAVKASLIIQRIRNLPVKVQWKQFRLTQSEEY